MLNFSELGTKPAAAQQAELYEAVNQVALGAMPLRLYLIGASACGGYGGGAGGFEELSGAV